MGPNSMSFLYLISFLSFVPLIMVDSLTDPKPGNQTEFDSSNVLSVT